MILNIFAQSVLITGANKGKGNNFMSQNKKITSWFKIIIVALVLNAQQCFAIDLAAYFPGLKPDADGRLETLNNEGGMAPTATGAELWLLADLKQQDNKKIRLLEIGPAFGRLPIELFMDGFNGSYTAIDLSEEHLTYLRQSLNKFPESKTKVNTIAGRFPQDTKNLPNNSFDVIVITHVFHFFEPQHFDHSLAELNRLLAPGGKIYLTAKTPYSTRYNSFIPVYEHRIREKIANPGYIDNVAAWVDPTTITPERLQKLHGRHLYFFTKEDLSRIFKTNNFKVVRCEEIPLGYDSPIWQAPKGYENREDAVILAEKPR